jgi:hypothetical protein
MFLLVFVTATAGKFGGCFVSSKILGLSNRDSVCVGVMMNTKGLVEVIVLNLGLDLGVINTKIFTVMVLMAVTTTVITTPMINFVFPKHLRDAEKEKEMKEMQESKHKHSIVSSETTAVQKGGLENQSSKIHSYNIATGFLRQDEVVCFSFLVSHIGWKGCDLSVGAVRFVESGESVVGTNMFSMASNATCPLCLDSSLKIAHSAVRAIGANMRYEFAVGKPDTFHQQLLQASEKWNADLIVVPMFRAGLTSTIHSVFEDVIFNDYLSHLSMASTSRSVALLLDSEQCIHPSDYKSKNGAFDIALVVRPNTGTSSFEMFRFARFMATNPFSRVTVFMVVERGNQSYEEKAHQLLDEELAYLKMQYGNRIELHLQDDVSRSDESVVQFIANKARFDLILYGTEYVISVGKNKDPSVYFGKFGKLLLANNVHTPLLAVLSDVKDMGMPEIPAGPRANTWVGPSKNESLKKDDHRHQSLKASLLDNDSGGFVEVRTQSSKTFSQ